MSVTRALAASMVACIALLPTAPGSFAADPSGPPEEAADSASALLARGAGYGQPRGEPSVRSLQRRLRILGYRPGRVDGLYGPRTEAAVESLQRNSGLAADGIVGPRTRRMLNLQAPRLVPGAGHGQPGGAQQVRAVQRRLRALGQRPGPVDGLYGPRTKAAIERFQRTVGQPAGGALSPATMAALARAESDRPARRASAAGRGSERGGRPDVVDDRTDATDEAGWTSLLPLAVLSLALAAIGGLLAHRLRGRRRKPDAAPTSPSSPEAGARHNALGYVSVSEPDALEGQELRDQVGAIETACRERGLTLTMVIRDLEAVDGARTVPPGLRRAFQRLAAGDATTLVVAELGRLGRSGPEVARVAEWLRRRELRLVAADDGLDTGARRPPARSGRPTPPHKEQPAGRTNGGSRRATDDASALMERLRAMRESGMTLQAIADRLNAENVPTLRGGATWRASGVQAATGYSRPSRTPAKVPRGGERNGNPSGRAGAEPPPERVGQQAGGT